MRYRGRLVGAGDALFVRSGCRWVRWFVSDFSPATGCIYGRRKRGPYERMLAGACWEIPKPAPPRLQSRHGEGYHGNGSIGSWSFGPPKLSEIERQNTARLSDQNGNISFETEANYASAIYVMPSSRRRR